ncbi:hypothetical protein OBBRIDRAFT_572757 [Obba rivulosa]|uniref:Uncharacterized protein n=1 Tax=Obba rivulosa TaxID=1052685 RepID=A0A8E2DT34_9APHY|nr:hypothetical protein OBBRIDRAFT_572757 [Obba rivulosa]
MSRKKRARCQSCSGIWAWRRASCPSGNSSTSVGPSRDWRAMQSFNWLYGASDMVQCPRGTEQTIYEDDSAQSQGQILMSADQFANWRVALSTRRDAVRQAIRNSPRAANVVALCASQQHIMSSMATQWHSLRP